MPYIDNDEHNTTAEPGNLDLARSLLGQGNTHVESVLKSPVPYFHCPRLIRRPAGPRTPWGLENRSEEQSTDRPHKHERAAAPQRDGERPHRRTPILPAPLDDQSRLGQKMPEFPADGDHRGFALHSTPTPGETKQRCEHLQESPRIDPY